MKVCISDVFGSTNRGDALLCDALVQSVKEAFPEATLSGVAHFPDLERDRHPDVDWQEAPSRATAKSTMVRRLANGARTAVALGYSAIGAPSRLSPLVPLPISQRKAIENIKEADLVVSSAGGFLLDANVTIYSHLLQFHLMRRFKKPYVLAPQTIGPIKSQRLKAMTANALSDAQFIAVREQYSYDFVIEDLGIPESKVIRTTDIAFEHEETSPEGAKEALASLSIGEDEKFIGATTVNWKFRGDDNPKLAQETYLEKMVALFKSIHERSGLRIVLYNQVSQDLPLARDVAARCAPFVVLDEADRSTEVMRAMIGRAEVMLGSRFHSCVFSLLARVPLFCLAYTYKSTGIMEDLRLSEFVRPIDSFQVDEVSDAVLGLLNDRAQAVSRIDASIADMDFPRFSGLLRKAMEDTALQPAE